MSTLETIHCQICGADEALHWDPQTEAQLRAHQMCFRCNFWREKVEWRAANNPKAAVIHGRHFMVEPAVKTELHKRELGYGGQPFTIRFHDGRVERTNNLWHQGTIPNGYWRDRLPDNAEFVREEVPCH